MNRLLIFGLGYSGGAIARAAEAAGFAVTGTTRAGGGGSLAFDAAEAAVRAALMWFRRRGRMPGATRCWPGMVRHRRFARDSLDRLPVEHRRLRRPRRRLGG